MKKIILGVVVTVLVLLIVGLVVLGLSIDGLVKRGVETMGPKFTKVDVRLDHVGLSLFSGAGEVSGLVIGNPAGFQTPQAISVGKARLVLQPSSLMSDKIIVRSVRVEAPEITLETGLAGNNLKKILANLEETTGGGGSTAPAEPKTSGAAKKFQVDEFIITGAKVNVALTGLGNQNIPLPEIRLSALGQGPEGITSPELTKVVLAAIEKAAAKAVTENAGVISKGAQNLVKGLTSGTNTAAVEKLGKGLGDLLKKK